jgi:hypothetical protein
MDDVDRPALDALHALLHELFNAADATFYGLAARTTFDRSQIQRAFRRSGKLALSPKLARALDRELGGDGRIAEAREAAYAEQRAVRAVIYGEPDRHSHQPTGKQPRMRRTTHDEPTASDPSSADSGENETNRRDALAAFAAGASALTLRIGTSIGGPGRKELFAAKDVVAVLAARYSMTPHEELLPEVGRHWSAVESILADGWRSDRYRLDFQVVAGQLTSLLSRLAFNMGDYEKSADFLGLVERHLDASGDPGLGAAVATMWSSLFFYRGDFVEALRAAQEGHRWKHRYDEARLFGYEARALGALGDLAAIDALENMERATVSVGAAEAGADPFTAEYGMTLRGHTLARLGKYREAVEITEVAVREFDRQPDPPYEFHGNAHISYAMALFGVDVEESARAALRALSIIDGRPTHTVLKRTGELAHRMIPHRRLATVGELRDRLLDISPRALPSGLST